MKRKVYLLFVTVLCLFAMTACGSEKSPAKYDEAVVEQVAKDAVNAWNEKNADKIGLVYSDESAEQYIEDEKVKYVTSNLEQLEQMYAQYGMEVEADIYAEYELNAKKNFDKQLRPELEEEVAKLKAWNATLQDAGAFVEVKDVKATFADAEDVNYVNVILQAKCEKADAVVTVPVLRNAEVGAKVYQYDVNGIKFEQIKSMGEKMSKAGLNTLMGVGLVFVLLIVICLLISTFGIFGKVGKKKEEKKETAAPAPAPVAAPEPVVEEDLTDDCELVAVITAAIMASMGDEAPADGLVVRSIRRRR